MIIYSLNFVGCLLWLDAGWLVIFQGMFSFYDDTICAPATVPGTGAIAIVRLSGPDAMGVAGRVVSVSGKPLGETEGYRLRFGTVLDRDGNVLDEVLVSVFRAPHSYTGEDSVEISCHSSKYIVSSLLSLLEAAGARLAMPGEFTRRAFLNGKMDLAQAEAVVDVISSSSEVQHRVAMNQLRGGYSAELGHLRSSLLEIASLLELELDFSEEDVEFADRSELRSLLEKALVRCSSLADSFRDGNAIRNGVPVAILGVPNSGKSTLLNALLGDDRAIVSDIPGTTRDIIEDCCVVGGVTFRFIDTAGIRESSDAVESEGIRRALKRTSQAKIVLGLVDASSFFGHDAVGRPAVVPERVAADDECAPAASVRSQLEMIFAAVDLSAQKLVILLSKSDKMTDNNIVNIVNDVVLSIVPKTNTVEVLPVSAKDGMGLEELRSKLVSMASEGLPEDATVVTNARHASALRASAAALADVIAGLDRGIPGDLLAEDLRAALESLGSITGEISSDEVLGEIFGRFCVGK